MKPKLVINTRKTAVGIECDVAGMETHIVAQMIVIGVVGSRRRNTGEDHQIVYQAIHHLRQKIGGNTILVSGGCPIGADLFAEEYAGMHRLPIIRHLPDQTQLREDVPIRAAWAIVNNARNTLIAADADVLIACVAPDRKGGTEDTIKKFKKLHPDGEVILV
jgi:hypothetical protein